MNKAILAGGVAALIAAVAGGLAFADAAPAAQERPAQARERGLRADADGDQRLSRPEFVQARVNRLTAADADRNGSVTPEEFRAAGEARRAERADRRFDRLDADDDGAISRAEFESAREARGDRGRRGHGGGQHRMAARGSVDIAQAEAKATEAFARMDADRDGYLTREERRAGHREMRQHRRDRVAGQGSQPSLPPAASE